jgi:hypothetical protein
VGQLLAGQFPPQVELAESAMAIKVNTSSMTLVLLLGFIILFIGYFYINLSNRLYMEEYKHKVSIIFERKQTFYR